MRRRLVSDQNVTLTSFPGGPSRPGGPVAPGSPCNSAKRTEVSAQGQRQTSNTTLSSVGFVQHRTELSENFFKANKSLVHHTCHAAYKNSSEASSASDAQGSVLLSSRTFATVKNPQTRQKDIHFCIPRPTPRCFFAPYCSEQRDQLFLTDLNFGFYDPQATTAEG